MLAEEVVSGALGPARERRQHLVRGLRRGIEGIDERLDEGDRPVEGAGIAPRLQAVGLGDLPVAPLGGLLGVQPEVDPQRHLVQLRREIEVGRSGEDRVAAQDHEQRNGAAVHVGRQLPERGELVHRARLDRRRVDDGPSHAAELRVGRVGQGMDGGRLMLAGNHHRRPGVREQVLHEGRRPGAVR